VDLEPQANNKDIYDIKNLCYHIIKVEPPKKNKEVPQCKNFQIFGHTQNYCFKTPKCLKCSEGHTSLNCPMSKKSKAKCANLGKGHTANWKGCITYKNALEKAHPKKKLQQYKEYNKSLRNQSLKKFRLTQI